MSIQLKVKAKSLAEEAKIIRREEQKQLGASRWLINKAEEENANDIPNTAKTNPFLGTFMSLHNHRTHQVRKAARATHLARGYLKGQAYEKMEGKFGLHSFEKRNELLVPVAMEVARMVSVYGPEKVDYVTIRTWMQA